MVVWEGIESIFQRKIRKYALYRRKCAVRRRIGRLTIGFLFFLFS